MGTLEESDDSVFGNLFLSSYICYVVAKVTRPQSSFMIKLSLFEFCLNCALDINFKLPGINGHASCKFHMVFYSRSNSTGICHVAEWIWFCSVLHNPIREYWFDIVTSPCPPRTSLSPLWEPFVLDLPSHFERTTRAVGQMTLISFRKSRIFINELRLNEGALCGKSYINQLS